MNKTRIQIAKRDIVSFFDEHPSQIFGYKELAAILSQKRDFWRLAERTNTQQFITFLIEKSKLTQLVYPFPDRTETRYVWGERPLLEVLLTLKKDAYFSHYTAVRMHGLTEQVPKTIYLNHEQKPKSKDSAQPHLEQDQIASAFSRPPRISQNAIDFEGYRVCMINGMHTNCLGVVNEDVTYDGNSKVHVRVTNIERTLIDITVRPVYSGGPFEVAKAFLMAKEQVSVNAMAAMLRKLNYVYPYHQAIGFYLERAEYKSNLLDLLRSFPMEHDFYLAHQMGETEYVKDWRLFIPKGF